jgi:hypothetical protein
MVVIVLVLLQQHQLALLALLHLELELALPALSAVLPATLARLALQALPSPALPVLLVLWDKLHAPAVLQIPMLLSQVPLIVLLVLVPLATRARPAMVQQLIVESVKS